MEYIIHQIYRSRTEVFSILLRLITAAYLMLVMIHHQTKTGQWQEALPDEGPHPDGILCRLRVQTGPYNGAALLPQTFDYRYFKVLVMAPYSKRINCHLHAQLYYPEQKTSPDFLRDWSQLVDDFE